MNTSVLHYFHDRTTKMCVCKPFNKRVLIAIYLHISHILLKKYILITSLIIILINYVLSDYTDFMLYFSIACIIIL